MIARKFTLALAAALTVASTPAGAQLKVVTSTTDLYDIAQAVGGSRIKATHIGEGYQDPHFIEAKPSFVLQLRNADVWAFVGLDLEIGWITVTDHSPLAGRRIADASLREAVGVSVVAISRTGAVISVRSPMPRCRSS